MHSLEQIKAMNAEAAKNHEEEGREPVVLDHADEFGIEPVHHLGDACAHYDDKHERLDTLFIDISGMGSPSEPALTEAQLKKKLADLISEHGPVMIALEEVGQFQGHLAVWKEEELD